MNVPFIVIAQTLVVEKASKCLDFTVTVIFVQIIVCTLCYEWPSQWLFWFHEFIWATITCLLSESLCMRMETKEIPLAINDLLE